MFVCVVRVLVLLGPFALFFLRVLWPSFWLWVGGSWLVFAPSCALVWCWAVLWFGVWLFGVFFLFCVVFFFPFLFAGLFFFLYLIAGWRVTWFFLCVRVSFAFGFCLGFGFFFGILVAFGLRGLVLRAVVGLVCFVGGCCRACSFAFLLSWPLRSFVAYVSWVFFDLCPVCGCSALLVVLVFFGGSGLSFLLRLLVGLVF